ncbi:MAG TPA: transposase [Ktedonobacteraceae bacterium]|nr:transposase [Ktedonobacteraceae bacterium]
MKQFQHITFTDVWKWGQELERLHTRIAPHFARPQPRRRALAYLQGLLSPLERKNGWSLAEHAREARLYGMQRVLVGSVWDADLARDDLRQSVMEHLGDPQAILVIDETSFPKRGNKSAGVQVQYCGTTDQVENCHVGVLLDDKWSRTNPTLDEVRAHNFLACLCLLRCYIVSFYLLPIW